MGCGTESATYKKFEQEPPFNYQRRDLLWGFVSPDNGFLHSLIVRKNGGGRVGAHREIQIHAVYFLVHC